MNLRGTCPARSQCALDSTLECNTYCFVDASSSSFIMYHEGCNPENEPGQESVDTDAVWHIRWKWRRSHSPHPGWAYWLPVVALITTSSATIAMIVMSQANYFLYDSSTAHHTRDMLYFFLFVGVPSDQCVWVAADSTARLKHQQANCIAGGTEFHHGIGQTGFPNELRLYPLKFSVICEKNEIQGMEFSGTEPVKMPPSDANCKGQFIGTIASIPLTNKTLEYK